MSNEKLRSLLAELKDVGLCELVVNSLVDEIELKEEMGFLKRIWRAEFACDDSLELFFDQDYYQSLSSEDFFNEFGFLGSLPSAKELSFIGLDETTGDNLRRRGKKVILGCAANSEPPRELVTEALFIKAEYRSLVIQGVAHFIRSNQEKFFPYTKKLCDYWRENEHNGWLHSGRLPEQPPSSKPVMEDDGDDEEWLYEWKLKSGLRRKFDMRFEQAQDELGVFHQNALIFDHLSTMLEEPIGVALEERNGLNREVSEDVFQWIEGWWNKPALAESLRVLWSKWLTLRSTGKTREETYMQTKKLHEVVYQEMVSKPDIVSVFVSRLQEGWIHEADLEFARRRGLL